MSSKKTKHPNKSNKSKNKPKPKTNRPKPKSKPKARPSPSNSNPNAFVYGFKVQSLSQINQNKTPKKNQKKSPAKTRKLQKSSPFSTASSTTQSIELYTSSVTQLLDPNHLNASAAASLHDLQCGTATTALQTFLSYPNLRRVFGIEQNKNFFHFATQNLMALIKNGYQNRKYLLVEQIPSIKMTIAEKASAAQSKATTFAVGDVVHCFIPLKQNNIKKRDNYQGVIRSRNADGIHFAVEMSATKSVVKRVHRESLFKPGTERTFEICRGNLFERSDSFRADILLLPYSISNDSFRSLLLTGCKRSPITCRILSFSHLESWDGFPAKQLRRIDANVYDNDRYDTNLSPFHKLYIYSHVLASALGSAPKDVLSDRLRVGDDITVRDVGVTPLTEGGGIQWFPGKVLAKDAANRTVTIEKDGFILDRGVCEIKVEEQRIHIISRKFAAGDLVTAYCPKMIESGHAELYTLYNGQVVACNSDGTYRVQFEDGETHPQVHECYVFARNDACKYAEGDVLTAYRYDKLKTVGEDGALVNIKKLLAKQSKNQLMEKQECIVRHINAAGTYRVEFMQCSQHYLHDVFCESWLKKIEAPQDSDEKSLEMACTVSTVRSETKLPLLFEIDYDKVLLWRPNVVAHWLRACGVAAESAQVLVEHAVNGVFLFELDVSLLMKEMGIGLSDSHRIVRYVKCLRHKLQYNMHDEVESEESENEMALQYELQAQQYKMEILQIKKQEAIIKEKLHKLVSNKSNSEEYGKYREWELKLECLALRQKKMSNKEIAAQLKKTQNWVKKTCKSGRNQIKKPGGSVVKQVEGLQAVIVEFEKKIKGKQNLILCARQKLAQLNL